MASALLCRLALLLTTCMAQPVLQLGFCAYNEDVNAPPPWPAVVAVAKKSFESNNPIIPLPGSADFTVNWHMAYAESSEDSINEGIQRIFGNRLSGVSHPPSHFVVGCGGSSTSEKVAPVSAMWEVPMVAWWAGSPTLSYKNQYPYFLRTRGTSTGNGAAVVRLSANFGWFRIGFLYEDHSFHVGVYNGAQTQALDSQVEVTGFRFFHFLGGDEINTEVWGATMNQAAASGLRVFGLSVMGAAWRHRTCLETAAAAGLHTSLLIGALELADFLPHHPPELQAQWNGMLGVDYAQSGMNDVATAFEEAWRAMTFAEMRTLGIPEGYVSSLETNAPDIFDNPPFMQFQAYLFDAIHSVLMAYQKLLDDGEGEQVNYGQAALDALYGLSFAGASGDVSFTPIREDIGGDRDMATFTVFNVRDSVVVEIGSVSSTVSLSSDPVFPDGGTDASVYIAAPICQRGYIVSNLACVPCPQAHGENLVGDACVPCSPGYYGPAEATGCLECAAGTFQNLTGRSACEPCSPGSFQDQPGQAACTTCPKGNYALQEATHCSLCSPGTFAEEIGSSACTSCEVGTYTASAGLSVCTMCSEGHSNPHLWTTMQQIRLDGRSTWVHQQGSEDVSACGCDVGAQARDGECLPCTDGMDCYGMGHVAVLPGYATDNDLSTYRCYGDSLRCPGGERGVCAAGRENSSISCTLCVAGKTPAEDGSCKDCEGSDLLPAVLGVIGLCAVLVIAYHVIDRTHRAKQPTGALEMALVASQLATLLQQYGVIAQLAIEWHDPMKAIMDFMSIFAFDLEVLRPACVAALGSKDQYVLRAMLVFMFLAAVAVIHAGFVLALHKGNFKRTAPTLIGVLGTLILTFNVSMVSTLLAPFQCLNHPNGKMTVQSYPGIMCWGTATDDHAAMVAVGLVTILLPIAFISLSLWAVKEYPGRMQKGDMSFLRSFCFLFFRFTTEAYWYGPFMITRNLIIAAVPIFSEVLHQVIILQVVMTLSLVVIAALQPWRQMAANLVDGGGHVCVIIVVTMALSFIKIEDMRQASEVCSVFFGICFALLPIAFIRGCYLQFLRNVKPYRFFLCHHKEGAGAFARCLKTYLMDEPSARRSVFLDCDNLTNLNWLFTYVANDTDTLLVLLSDKLLLRPWCVGEITTAHINKVDTVPIMLPGGMLPSEKFIAAIEDNVPDITCLTEYGMDVPAVADALHSLAARPVLAMKGRLTPTLMQALAGSLANHSPKANAVPPVVWPKEEEQLPSDVRTIILADASDFQAVSAELVLRKMMLPIFSTNTEQMPQILPKDSQLPTSANTVLLICTAGLFSQPDVMKALLAAIRQEIRVVPIVTDEAFQFPTRAYLASLRPFLATFCQEPDELLQAIFDIFLDIAVIFKAGSASESELETKASTVALRMQGKSSGKYTKSNNRPSISKDGVGKVPSGRSFTRTVSGQSDPAPTGEDFQEGETRSV